MFTGQASERETLLVLVASEKRPETEDKLD